MGYSFVAVNSSFLLRLRSPALLYLTAGLLLYLFSWFKHSGKAVPRYSFVVFVTTSWFACRKWNILCFFTVFVPLVTPFNWELSLSCLLFRSILPVGGSSWDKSTLPFMAMADYPVKGLSFLSVLFARGFSPITYGSLMLPGSAKPKKKRGKCMLLLPLGRASVESWSNLLDSPAQHLLSLSTRAVALILISQTLIPKLSFPFWLSWSL